MSARDLEATVAYSLGIDVGTTFSAAATLDDDESMPSMVGLGNRALQIPSVVFVRDVDCMVVGDRAEHLAMSDPTHVAREFKRRLGDPVAMMVAGNSYPPQRFMAEMVRWIRDQTVERRGEPPTRVTLTHPASWSEFKVDLLREAARDAGLPRVLTCTEPVAAALNYAAKNRVAVGDRICLYDFGGGTFDVCLLEKTPDGFDIIGRPDGDPQLGGINFDKAIIGKIVDDNSSLFATVDPDDPGVFRFQRDCVLAKEALSVDVDTVIPLSLNGWTTNVRLNRHEFEAIIEDDLDRTIELTRRELRKAGLEASELASFVLVGGSSRIPLVTEKLSASFRTTVARNTHPKHEVALGAALFGRWASTGRQVHGPDGAPAGARRRAPRRLLRLAVVGGSTALLVGGVIVGSQLFTGTAEAQKPDPVGVSAAASTTQPPGSGATSSTGRAAEQRRAPATGSGIPATGSGIPTPAATTTPVSTGAETTAPTTTVGIPGSPLPMAPGTFDQLTLRWFQTLCTGGEELQQHDLRAGQSYRSLSAAQAAFVESFAQRADIAASTAAALESYGSGPVARGNMDTAATVQGLRELSGSLRAAAERLRALSPQTSSDLAIAAQQLNETVAAQHRPADLGALAVAERAFVLQLPGCST